MKMETKLTNSEKTFRMYQRQYLKAELKEIEIALNKKLEKAFNSGAIPEHWKQSGNHLLTKAIIHSFCLDRPYEMFDKANKKEQKNIHLFL
jgi:hypothetical protein